MRRGDLRSFTSSPPLAFFCSTVNAEKRLWLKASSDSSLKGDKWSVTRSGCLCPEVWLSVTKRVYFETVKNLDSIAPIGTKLKFAKPSTLQSHHANNEVEFWKKETADRPKRPAHYHFIWRISYNTDTTWRPNRVVFTLFHLLWIVWLNF